MIAITTTFFFIVLLLFGIPEDDKAFLLLLGHIDTRRRVALHEKRLKNVTSLAYHFGEVPNI